MSRTTSSMDPAVRDYLLTVGIDEHPELARLREATEAALEDRAIMLSSPEQAAFLAWLIPVLGARRCVEVGTFTGYNALSMALALPDDGVVVACDVSEQYVGVGQPFWAAAGMADKIDLRIAPALQTMDALLADGAAGTFDLVFIDADKSGYCDYYERALQLLRVGGAIAVDNVLWSGRVADQTDQEPSTNAIRALNERIRTDQRVDRLMLPVGDGVFMARKR